MAITVILAATATCGVARSQSANGKYDTDGDRLIEIEYLEQLNAIRYDLDGNGRADDLSEAEAYAAVFPISAEESACYCNGYELARSLDFNEGDSYGSNAVNPKWTTGDGWLPIGFGDNAFRSTFEGNGNTISNLYINRATNRNDPGTVGLFGRNDGTIRQIGLLHVDVAGVNYVGGLAGSSVHGRIIGSYVTGSVSGNETVGGLVGHGNRIISSYAATSVSGAGSVGGLVGHGTGIIAGYATGDVSGDRGVGGLAGGGPGISHSYATGDVTGKHAVGGLAGYGVGISYSYATGDVLGEQTVGGLVGHYRGSGGDGLSFSYAAGSVSGVDNVGGLVGSNLGDVSFSYATGSVSGTNNTGGLVGRNLNGVVSGAFWDTETSGQQRGVGEGNSAGVEGKTTAELQSPTGYTGIYTVWLIDLDNAERIRRHLAVAAAILAAQLPDSTRDPAVLDLWDFGNSGQYPALKLDFNGDNTVTWQEFGSQGRSLPTPIPTATPMLTPTPSPTPAPNYTPTPTPIATPIAKPMPSPTLRPTPVPTDTLTPEPIPAPTLMPAPEPTPMPAPEPTAAPVPPPDTPTPEPQVTSVPLAATTEAPGAGADSPPGSAPTPPVQIITVVVTATPAPSPEPTAAPAAESVGGACSLPAGRQMPMGAAAVNLFLLAAPLGMIWGLKWRGRRAP